MIKMLDVSILAIVLIYGAGSCTTPDETTPDAAIKQILIQESIARYPGNCPCPYSVDRAGRRCGKRSAYSRLGGASPLCYPSDITDDKVNAH